jgi:hypothetical protein
VEKMGAWVSSRKGCAWGEHVLGREDSTREKIGPWDDVVPIRK